MRLHIMSFQGHGYRHIRLSRTGQANPQALSGLFEWRAMDKNIAVSSRHDDLCVRQFQAIIASLTQW